MGTIERLVKEAEPVGNYDMIATHLFWLSEKQGKPVPSLRGRLLILATAVEYYRQHEKPNIILTTGQVWGDKYPSVAEVAKEELVKKYKIPIEKIVVELTDAKGNPNRETTAEIEGIIKTAGENRVLEIAEPEHLKTIRNLHEKFYASKNTHIDFKNTDEILGKDALRNLIPRLRHSKYELDLKFYEFAKRLLIKFAGYTPEKFKQGAKSRDKKGSPLPRLLATEPNV